MEPGMAVGHYVRVSPVSRGRKNTSSRRTGQRVVRSVPVVPLEEEFCDCPACSGEPLSLETLIEGLMASAADLLETEDPIEVELFGASLLAAGLAGDLISEEVKAALTGTVVPAVAEYANREAVAALLALDSMGVIGPVAAEAAQRLMEAGVPAPPWAREVREPLRVGQCRRYLDTKGDGAILACSFERAGRGHGFMIDVDHGDCAAATHISLVPLEELEEYRQVLEGDDVTGVHLSISTEVLDPAEFRWQVERAVNARAVHDLEDEDSFLIDEDEDDDAEGPAYHQLAALLLTRMQALPEPPRPPAPHGREAALPASPRLITGAKLPPKRKKAQGPAPIYQIKVGLRGAKPPIWRRLELPADTSLAALHRVIQTAFGWQDSHMHVFETPWGDFGVADRELGHRAEGPVTLEQVAPAAGDRLTYTYDLGDDWHHEIVVEKVRDREQVAYPRCTGGRRAAPPDDCGGIWGYHALVEALADRSHPDHRDYLTWLGLESAAEFDPRRFDAAEITRDLAELG